MIERTESAEKAFQELAGYMFGLISQRKGAPRDDMLSRLVNDDGPDGVMEPGEMISVSVPLLLAWKRCRGNPASRPCTCRRGAEFLQR